MKQIGAPEAGRIGGLGSMRPRTVLCIVDFELRLVTTNAARHQEDLALNPQKLAGQCGKLKCCLVYGTGHLHSTPARIFRACANRYQILGSGEYCLVKTDILSRTMVQQRSTRIGRHAAAERRARQGDHPPQPAGRQARPPEGGDGPVGRHQRTDLLRTAWARKASPASTNAGDQAPQRTATGNGPTAFNGEERPQRFPQRGEP